MTPTIVILALIAAFLGLRLYSVLGRRDHDMDVPLPRTEERARAAAPLGTAVRPVAETPQPPAARTSEGMVYEPAAEIGIRAILAADRSFDVGRFIGGAQAAYRMTLEAFWSGNRESLRTLCDADSYEAFATAIDAREARGETLQNRLVCIDKAIITHAEVDNGLARVVVRFEADIAAVTRDAEGRVIAGSMTDAVATHDSWSFVRPIGSADPNWLLDETDAG